MLWATMSYYESLRVTMSHYEPLWTTMSHYEPLWPKILTLRPPMTQISIEYNVTTKKKTKEVFHLSQFCHKNTYFGQIWPQNLKMLCFKWNLPSVCIPRCWLRIWEKFFEILTPSTFFDSIWSQNLKMFCFKWNLARVCIRGCSLRIW